MSDFTIEQLEALKEGTPDVMHRYSMDFRGERSHSVKTDSGMVRAHTGYGPDGGTAYKDAELFAAAPALVDALIAEKRSHQELRAEVERLRDDYRTRPYPYGEVARTLTRILEADNG